MADSMPSATFAGTGRHHVGAAGLIAGDATAGQAGDVITLY
jgi:hypothetical protein